MYITNLSRISFLSNREREAEMEDLMELKRKKREEEIKLIQRLNHQYPSVNDALSTDVAGFLSQFTCAIQNNSEHNIMEFFGDEQTATDLQKGLSSECQADSKKLREMIQDLNIFDDPVRTLLVANRMKKFAPREGILNDIQQKTFVEGVKSVISTAIRNSDLDKFEPADKAAILEMVQRIEDSDSVNFPIEEKLKNLVNKLNEPKLNLNFIPPVKVKNQYIEKTVNLLKR